MCNESTLSIPHTLHKISNDEQQQQRIQMSGYQQGQPFQLQIVGGRGDWTAPASLILAFHGGPPTQQAQAAPQPAQQAAAPAPALANNSGPASQGSSATTFSLRGIHLHFSHPDFESLRFFNLIGRGDSRQLRYVTIFPGQGAPWLEDHTIFTSSNLDMLGLTNYVEEPSRVWQANWELPLEQSGHVVLEAGRYGLPTTGIDIYTPVANGMYVYAGRWSIARAAVFRPRHRIVRTMLERRGLSEEEIEERWGDIWAALYFEQRA